VSIAGESAPEASEHRARDDRGGASAEPSNDVAERLRSAGCVFAEDEARLLIAAAGSAAELDRLVAGRVAGRPLEQLLGWASFCGLRVAVEPGVFVPRRRTELLVRLALGLVAADSVLVELCCGSAAISLALAGRGPAEWYALDLDPVAVRCARRNLAGTNAQVLQGDLYRPLPSSVRGRVDLLAANAPYVPTEAIGSMPPEARDHEPRLALDGGPDGLDVQRRIIAEAPSWLAAGGCLLVETGRAQAPVTAAAMESAGLTARIEIDDELDATAVVGFWPG
jgi:release factor glutamine methyltransferase